MASVRINEFQNLPSLDAALGVAIASLQVHGIYIPGSISFNKAAVFISANITNNTSLASLTASFGLYSFNGSTLSLANSASFETTASTTFRAWVTMATSATQDITPGNWYFGYVSTVEGNTRISNMQNVTWQGNISQGSIEGYFVRGYASFSTGGLPTGIESSALVQEGAASLARQGQYPYIVIGA